MYDKNVYNHESENVFDACSVEPSDMNIVRSAFETTDFFERRKLLRSTPKRAIALALSGIFVGSVLDNMSDAERPFLNHIISTLYWSKVLHVERAFSESERDKMFERVPENFKEMFIYDDIVNMSKAILPFITCAFQRKKSLACEFLDMNYSKNELIFIANGEGEPGYIVALPEQREVGYDISDIENRVISQNIARSPFARDSAEFFGIDRDFVVELFKNSSGDDPEEKILRAIQSEKMTETEGAVMCSLYSNLIIRKDKNVKTTNETVEYDVKKAALSMQIGFFPTDNKGMTILTSLFLRTRAENIMLVEKHITEPGFITGFVEAAEHLNYTLFHSKEEFRFLPNRKKKANKALDELKSFEKDLKDLMKDMGIVPDVPQDDDPEE